MKLHEYQARKLLSDYGIPVSRGEVVFRPEEARGAFARVANPTCMVKVQVLMGGRGKAGGIKPASTAQGAEELAASFIGRSFSTYQSGGESRVVRAVMITEDVQIEKEYYLGIVIDRSQGLPVILFSVEGGVDIEEVASKDPKAILKHPYSPSKLPTASQLADIFQVPLKDRSIAEQIGRIAERLAALFVEKDAAICEINPLVRIKGGTVLAIDAKIVFDDNALFRHEDIKAMRDPEEDDDRERRAKEIGLSYVSMNGNVGCLVNGAGLAMATMDVIKLAGGEPANFLDVGGGATTDQVREGFKVILQDKRVEAILVNIFGGIMKCDVIAEGIIQASKEIRFDVPLIVRLEGTRVEEGRALLKNSGLKILSCTTIKEAAETAVKEAEAHRARQ